MYSVVGADGNQYGPIDKPQLAQWAREGRVVQRTQVIDHETTRRYLACDVPELAAIFSAPPIDSTAVGQPTLAHYDAAGALGRVGVDSRPRKSRLAAGLLGVLLPGLGAHRFYLGYPGIGVIMLLSTLFCGVGVIWGFIEGIMCFAGSLPDADGRPLAD